MINAFTSNNYVKIQISYISGNIYLQILFASQCIFYYYYHDLLWIFYYYLVVMAFVINYIN